MVIEFMGMPGVGKTYLADALIKNVDKKSVKAVNLVEMSRHNTFYKVYFRFLRVLTKILPNYKKLRYELAQFVKPYANKNAAFNDIYIDSYVNTLIMYKLLHDKYDSSKNLYILDEGIVQQLVNMKVNYDIDDDTVKNIISAVDKRIDLVYILASFDITIASIEKRNRHVCYIDELKDEQLKAFLEKYNESCEALAQTVSPVVVKRGDNIEDNIIHICREMHI